MFMDGTLGRDVVRMSHEMSCPCFRVASHFQYPLLHALFEA